MSCEIVSSRVQSHGGKRGSTYSGDIVFRYHVGANLYTSSHYSLSFGSSSGYAGKATVVNAYPPGSSTTCRVNPDDPTEAVLNRGFRGEMALGLIPLVFFAVGVGGIMTTVRKVGYPVPSSASR